ARRRGQGGWRRFGRHRSNDVRVLRVQHRAQPDRRLHDRRRSRRAGARPVAARLHALADAVGGAMSASATPARVVHAAKLSLAGTGTRSDTSRGAPTVAVTDFTLDIAQGEFLVIVGPSGCGKTTI